MTAGPRVAVTLDPHAVAAPSYASHGAAGADLSAALPEDAPRVLEAGQRSLVPTGVRLALPPGWEAQIRPRSGRAFRDGLTVLNTPGTIDADYRGEIQVLLINLGATPVTIQRGERIAQMVIAPAPQARFDRVETLDETARGDGGFGSTGDGG